MSPDSKVLRQAAEVLRQRSKRPKALMLDVVCKMLLRIADKIDSGAL